MKLKVEKSDIEWDDFVLQEELKSLMYIDNSLRGDPNNYKLMDKLKLKIACVLIEIQQASFLLVFHSREESLLFVWNTLMPKIFSHIYFF